MNKELMIKVRTAIQDEEDMDIKIILQSWLSSEMAKELML